jgi:hypothetical protein
MGPFVSIIISTAISLYLNPPSQGGVNFINEVKHSFSSSPVKESAVSGTNSLPSSVLIPDVPFTPQAPFGEWSDPRQEDGCEEANLAMAMAWVKQETLTPEKAKEKILAMTDLEAKDYHNNETYDLSIDDTLKLLKQFFNYDNAWTRHDIGITDIKKELAAGNLVIIPVNGHEIGNPHYKQPGPERHQILVTGYDDRTREFTVNDPGTRYGKNYHFSYDAVTRALRDYKTGNKVPITENRTAMLVIHP